MEGVVCGSDGWSDGRPIRPMIGCVPPHATSLSPSHAPVSPERSSESERLQRRIDTLAQQVLQARDAVLGAEAELGVVRARVAELEQQVHVRDVEIAELRAGLTKMGKRPRAVDVGVAAGDRLARGVARRVTRSAGTSQG